MKSLILKGLSVVALCVFLASVASAQRIEKQISRGLIDEDKKICIEPKVEQPVIKKATLVEEKVRTAKRAHAIRKEAALKVQ